jgi:hypothetical protein
MKLNLFIFPLLLIFFSCNKPTENSLVKINIKGQVKLLILKKFEAEEKFGELNRLKLLEQIELQFNKSGNITNSLILNNKREIKNKTIYKYDKKDKIIRKLKYNSKGVIVEKIKYNYNQKGELIQTLSVSQKGSIQSKTEYIYDDYGNKVEESYYDSSFKLKDKFIYKYENNKLIASSFYDYDGKLNSKNKYKYDKFDNVIEEIEFNAQGLKSSKTSFFYDENKNIIKQVNNWIGYSRYIERFTYLNQDKEKNWTKIAGNSTSISNNQFESSKYIIDRIISYY